MGKRFRINCPLINGHINDLLPTLYALKWLEKRRSQDRKAIREPSMKIMTTLWLFYGYTKYIIWLWAAAAAVAASALFHTYRCAYMSDHYCYFRCWYMPCKIVFYFISNSQKSISTAFYFAVEIIIGTKTRNKLVLITLVSIKTLFLLIDCINKMLWKMRFALKIFYGISIDTLGRSECDSKSKFGLFQTVRKHIINQNNRRVQRAHKQPCSVMRTVYEMSLHCDSFHSQNTAWWDEAIAFI